MVWRRNPTQHESLTITEDMPTAVHCGLVEEVLADTALPVLHSSPSHVLFTRPQPYDVLGSLPLNSLIAATTGDTGCHCPVHQKSHCSTCFLSRFGVHPVTSPEAI